MSSQPFGTAMWCYIYTLVVKNCKIKYLSIIYLDVYGMHVHVFASVWKYICVWVQMHMCAHAYRAQRLVPSVFLGCSPPYILRCGKQQLVNLSSLNSSPPYILRCGKQQLVNLVSLASLLQRALVSALQVLGLHTDCHIHLALMRVLGIQTLFLTSVHFTH